MHVCLMNCYREGYRLGQRSGVMDGFPFAVFNLLLLNVPEIIWTRLQCLQCAEPC